MLYSLPPPPQSACLFAIPLCVFFLRCRKVRRENISLLDILFISIYMRISRSVILLSAAALPAAFFWWYQLQRSLSSKSHYGGPSAFSYNDAPSSIQRSRVDGLEQTPSIQPTSTTAGAKRLRGHASTTAAAAAKRERKATFVSSHSFSSSVHCVGKTFTETSWAHESCEFRNICWDRSSKDFVLYRTSGHAEAQGKVSIC